MQTEKHFAYLIQRCKDGFVVREFQADRTYGKEAFQTPSFIARKSGARFMTRKGSQEPTIGVV